MARVWVLLVSLLVIWPVQQSQGNIVELTKFHGKPADYVEVSFDRDDHLSPPTASELSRVVKRQAGGLPPQVDGLHEFHDGYYRARIYYPGGNSHVILVLTYNWRNNIAYQSNLYRSTNYGNTFTEINDQVNGAILYQRFYTNGSTLVFVHASLPSLYYTLDEGETFTAVAFSQNTLVTTTVVYHPTRDGWIMMKDQFLMLYMTKDYGNTWISVAQTVDTFQWADGNWDADDRRIYFNTTSSHFYTSDYPHFGQPQEFDSNLGAVDTFTVVGRYIFAQRTDSGVVALYVSDRRRPFKKAHIPIPGGHQSYLVSHIDDMQAMVIVEHEGDFYNLYLSDESGLYFSLSLRDIAIETVNNRYQIDLELINGLNGTLIANRYTREDPALFASSVRTVVSYDNGALWQALRPPNEDVDGNVINCEPPLCSLHLHMDTSNYARLGVYSLESAPGIIVAHGNTGETLRNFPDLYISRDGGITWRQTLAGSWGVNLADHGGLMVVAKDYHQEPSMVLKYSCDEGYSWSDFTFIDHNITVFGVITEPGHHTTVASLYGGPWGTGVPFEWIVITVEFAGIFSRVCRGDDYYSWLPWDVRSDSDCILGSSIIIERRRPEVCCLNGREFNRESDYHICECTIEDYECDYGYARPDPDAPCVRDNTTILPYNHCGDGKTTTYIASTGYRKIGGDVCSGGEEDQYKPYVADCCAKDSVVTTPTTTTETTTSSSSTQSSSTTHTGGGSSTTSGGDSSTESSDSKTRATTSTHPGGAKGRTSSSVDSGSKVAALSTLLVLAFITAVLFLALFFIITFKYRGLKQKYIRVLTAAEPDLHTLKASGDDIFEDFPTVPGDDDDDDKPLIP